MTTSSTKVVSARYAELCVEKTKVEFLERENAKLHKEVAELRAKLEGYHDHVKGEYQKEHTDHIQSLQKQNDRLFMAIPYLLEHSRQLLPPRLPTRRSLENKQQLAMRLNNTAPQNQDEWHQRLAYVEEVSEKEYQGGVHKAIVEDLTAKIKTTEQGQKRLEELRGAIVKLEQVEAKTTGTEAQAKTREMVQCLKTEETILAEGLRRPISKT